MTKTHITRLTNLKYLGFGFYYSKKTGEWRCRSHQDSIKSFERKLKKYTCRRKSMNFQDRVK